MQAYVTPITLADEIFMRAEEFTTDKEKTFSSRALNVKGVTVAILSNNNTVVDVHIEFRGQTHDVWEQIQSKPMFSYADEICGPIVGFGFDSKKRIYFYDRLAI